MRHTVRTWHEYTAAIGRHVEDIGTLSTVPADLESAMPGIERHFRYQHVEGDGACGWQALYYAMGDTAVLPIRLYTSATAQLRTVLATVAWDGSAFKVGGEKLRRKLVALYVSTNSRKPDKKKVEKQQEYERVWQRAVDNQVFDSAVPIAPWRDIATSISRSHPSRDLQALWLATSQASPPINLIVICEEATVVVRRDSSTASHTSTSSASSFSSSISTISRPPPPAPSTRGQRKRDDVAGTERGDRGEPGWDEGTFTCIECQTGPIVPRVMFMSPTGTFTNMRRDGENTIVFNLFSHTVLLQEQNDRGDYVVQPNRRHHSSRYWVLTDPAGRVRWNHTDPAIEFLMQYILGKWTAIARPVTQPFIEERPASRARQERLQRQHEQERQRQQQQLTDGSNGEDVAQDTGSGSDGADGKGKERKSARGHCSHFKTCAYPRAKCHKWHNHITTHDRTIHNQCALDLWTQHCPAFDIRQQTVDRAKFKAEMMAGDSTTEWNPQPPPDCVELTPQNELLDPDITPRLRWSEPEIQKVTKGRAGWEKERTKRVSNGEWHFKAQADGHTRLITQSSLLRFTPPSSPSSTSSSPLTILRRIPAGDTVLLPSLQYWNQRPQNVSPILFHPMVEREFAAPQNAGGRMLLFRLHATDRPGFAPVHLRPTNSVVFPRDTSPVYYAYYRVPFTLIHPRSPPLAQRLNYDPRIQASKPTRRGMYDGELDFGSSLNSTTYNASSVVTCKVQKDGTESKWPHCSTDDATVQPVMSVAEQKDREHEQQESEQHNMEIRVQSRAIVGDDRRDDQQSDDEYRALLDKRIDTLTARLPSSTSASTTSRERG